MRTLFLVLAAILITFSYEFSTSAQASASNIFAANLSLGSSGAQVAALQRLLNRDADTRIASAGPGSPGNETAYFGLRTKAAVVRFQEKYLREVLAPAGLMQGNGRVGYYTRGKLNELSASTSAIRTEDVTPAATQSTSIPTTTSTQVITRSAVQPAIASSATSTPVIAPPTDYLVSDSEKIDIYAGDAMLGNVRNKISAAINAAVASQSATDIALPVITRSDVPGVVIGMLSPQSGVPGTRVSIQGDGISANSVVYFGEKYILRAVSRDASGNFSFIVPSIPPAHYDVAIRTGNTVSNTTMFVVRDQRNPSVHIQNISPSAIAYGDTLTITGSGFTKHGNVVVTNYQKFADVPSPDGKTLVVRLTPDVLRESAKIGDGTRNVPMYLYVVNDYGFSYSTKSFTMSI